MTIPRESPYVYVSWIKRLMAGENSCEWATWFKSHYQGYEKVPSDFDADAWQMAHAADLNDLRVRLEADGLAVFTENQNSFRLKGSSATLAGTPDLVSLSGSAGTIYDVKTGRPRSSDSAQVMVYMWAIPRAFPQYKDVAFDGKVVYRDHVVDIPAAAAVDEGFGDHLTQLIRRVASLDPARKAPSPSECSFCDITKGDCAERAAEGGSAEAETDEF